MGCLQLERADGTAIIFAEIPKRLQCKKDTFEEDEKYHPFPTLKDQTESKIAEVDCQEYEEAFQEYKKIGINGTSSYRPSLGRQYTIERFLDSGFRRL